MNQKLSNWQQELDSKALEEYKALRRSLQRNDGFGLFFVQCYPATGENIIAKIKEDISQKKIELLRLTEPIDSLYNLIINFPNIENINILFISGLEYSLYQYEQDTFDIGRYTEALASYDQAIEIKPDYDFAWYNRGNALSKLGRLDEAIASYNKAIVIKPDFDEAWYHRGLALRSLGRTKEAIASYDKALEIKPDKDAAWHNRGLALRNLGRYEEAIASYDKALEIKPDKDAAWFGRGLALRKLGRLDEAIASYDKALEIKSDNDAAWYNRACYLALQNKIEPAIENLAKAISLNMKYQAMAKTDSDFDNIREDSQFQSLINQ